MGSDIDFWYRVVVGPEPGRHQAYKSGKSLYSRFCFIHFYPSASDTEGMWCHGRESMYPSSLMPINFLLIPEQQSNQSDSSVAVIATIQTILPLLIIVLFH